jgi:hypothetical protein
VSPDPNEIDNAGCTYQSKYCPAQTFNQCMNALEQDTYLKNLVNSMFVHAHTKIN